ncbi:Abhydrolase domain-containing protein 1 [Folsomia candida]|uniref:Abhydrolase domain-containing protein 1 n=1 Tax=Folsomia candida TaxID=158441 RepID=A0A226ENZ2_FOLCA|nr:Abhydrolase domain-containing protein 1 [Folsomia candida]
MQMNLQMQALEKVSENIYLLAGAVSSLAVLITYYLFNVAKEPRIHTSNEKLRAFLDKHVHTLKNKYYPSCFWEGRLQSVMGLRLRLSPAFKLPYRREIVTLLDGGQVGIDFLEPTQKKDKEPSLKVLILPGLTSSSQTSYVKTLAMTCQSAGATVIVLNHRGLGGVPIKTPRLYSASNCEDLVEIIHYLKRKYPGEKMMTIGTSMGGMVFCQYMVNHQQEAQETFICAMVISICWDVVNGVKNLEKPFINHYVINYGLTQNVKFLSKMYRQVLEILRSTNLREFDSHFTAPQFGFETVMDYYRSATVIDNVDKFTIPVFGLSSEDDPLQPLSCLPIKQAEMEGSNLAMIVTVRGGHLGFLEGVVRKPFHYMERVVHDFVTGVRNHRENLLGFNEN